MRDHFVRDRVARRSVLRSLPTRVCDEIVVRGNATKPRISLVL